MLEWFVKNYNDGVERLGVVITKSLVLLILFTIIDTVLTVIALMSGKFFEINPLIRAVLRMEVVGVFTFITLKILLIMFFWLFMTKAILTEKFSKVYGFFMVLAVAFYIYVTTLNLINLVLYW